MRAGEHSSQEYIEETETYTITVSSNYNLYSAVTQKVLLQYFQLGTRRYNTQQIVLENPLRLYPKKELIYNKVTTF